MTKLLEKAFNAISQLSEPDQDSVASFILEELASEERWTNAFSASGDKLTQLAKEAIAEYKSGKSRPLNL